MHDELIFGERRARKHWVVVPEYAHAVWVQDFADRDIPGWLGAMAGVAVFLSYGYAHFCSGGTCRSFLLLDQWPRSNSMNWPAIPLRQFPPPRWMSLPAESLLSGHLFTDMADDLRYVAAHLGAGETLREALQMLHRWVTTVQHTADPHTLTNTSNARATWSLRLVQQVVLADSLRSDDSVRSV